MRQTLLLMMFVATAAMTSVGLQAQDIIVKRDGTTIKSRVVEIGEQEVTYKAWPLLHGNDYKISVNDIATITFENGEVERFNAPEPVTPTGTPGVTFFTETAETASGTSTAVKASDFDFYGLYYAADFDAADHGVYGYIMHGFSDSGLGLSFGLKTNFFIEDKDYASYMFGIGPSFCAPINENFCVFAPLCFFFGSTGTIDGDTGKKKTEFTMGADLMPSLGIKSGRFMLTLGLDVAWAKGSSKLGTGFIVALGVNM